MNKTKLAAVRRAYARQIMAAWKLNDIRLENAIADTHREDYLGPGPWQTFDPQSGYSPTPSDDPVHLYQDILIGILPKKGLNNGQPSFLTYLISLGRLNEGEHAVHIGAGVGYYTAIMAKLTGTTGKITAIEYEAELAAKAGVNLSSFSNVSVVQGDGSSIRLEPADVIYVNAGATRPADVWLDALNDNGRLVLPLTVRYMNVSKKESTRGAIFLVERKGSEYFARWKSPTMIYPCAGMRDEASETALGQAFDKGGWEKVTRLYRTDEIDQDRCWMHAPGWSLAYD